MGGIDPGLSLSLRLSGKALRWLFLITILPGTGCRPGDSPRASASDLPRIDPARPSLHLLNLADQETNPFQSADPKWLVFIFISIDCPISNRYAPEIRRLDAKFSPRGVKFWLIHPNADESAAAIRKHNEEYQYRLDALRDPKHLFVNVTQVHVTPEVVVCERTGRMLYRGRIDNRFADLGKERAAPTVHDLEEALAAILQGKLVPQPETKAVGCYIPD